MERMNFKNILITGGAGFIGSHLALALVKQGCTVTVLDHLSPQIHGENPEQDSFLYQSIIPHVTFIKGDVTQRNDWNKALRDQEVVVHLAAETGTGQSMYRIHRYAEVNVSGTAHLLDALVNDDHSVKKVIVASSRAIYGEGKYLHPVLGNVYPSQRNAEEMKKGNFEVVLEDLEPLKALPTDESSRIHPVSVYGMTKQYQEEMLLSVTKVLGIPAVALRFQNVYGEGQSLINPYTGILSVFSNQIFSGKPVRVFEDGKESRDFIHIDDAVRSFILAMENNILKNEAVNIGTGIPVTVLEVAQQLIKNYRSAVPVQVTGQFRIGDIRHNFADTTKAELQLGFKAKISFEEGLKRFCTWVQNQEIKDNQFERSLAEMTTRKMLF